MKLSLSVLFGCLLAYNVLAYLSPLVVLNAHTNLITSVKISNDGAFFVSGAKDNLVKVWNASYSTSNSFALLHT
jgi:WD40 repeat protein